ncbi:MAG: DUF411 domain-containing protein [Spiribacter salinus]|uniref:DUF411 domain-containing protein n=1 Tax=Spiribacter salinus TaxID=1335746 RepID=A0A540VQC8_9GAMM|nr:MAG: DUF411 domain-containing protein [Spiribacter salinus]
MNRIRCIAITLALPLMATGHNAFATDIEINVVKTPTCGCCTAWVDHLKDRGFNVETRDVTHAELNNIKAKMDIGPGLASCHTAVVDNYFIEGHVHANEIRSLIEDAPNARGLTVPGMPIGSPGMEMGDERDAYETLLVKHDGATETYREHR